MPQGLGHDPQPAGARSDRQRLALGQFGRLDSCERGARRVEVFQGAGEVAEVVLAQRGDDVEAAGELAAAVDHPGEAADHDVADAVALERLEQRVGIEPRPLGRFVAETVEQGLQALLRRQEQAPVEFGVEQRVGLAFGDLELEDEAAGLDDRAEVLEARVLTAGLPACDLGAVAAEPLRELGLRQLGLESRFADDLRAGHRDELYSGVDTSAST